MFSGRWCKCIQKRERVWMNNGQMCVCECVMNEKEKNIYNTLKKEVPWEQSETEYMSWMTHGYSVLFSCLFFYLGGCPQCPCLLLYVVYQNIIECWPACLYPWNKGDFLSVSVCAFIYKKIGCLRFSANITCQNKNMMGALNVYLAREVFRR